MDEQWWRELVGGHPARPAILGVVRVDGRAHLTPVWTDVDGADIVFMTSAETIKGKAIVRDPRVTLCWQDDRPPFSFVQISGTATTSTDPEELFAWATRIGGRYMGADLAEAYGRRNAVPPEMVVRVTVDRVVAQRDVAAF